MSAPDWYSFYVGNDLFLDTPFLLFEADIVNATLEPIVSLPSTTISHIPCSVRPRWAQVLTQELKHAHSGSIWGAIRIMMLAKCVLRLPPRGGRSRRFSASSFILENLT